MGTFLSSFSFGKSAEGRQALLIFPEAFSFGASTAWKQALLLSHSANLSRNADQQIWWWVGKTSAAWEVLTFSRKEMLFEQMTFTANKINIERNTLVFEENKMKPTVLIPKNRSHSVVWKYFGFRADNQQQMNVKCTKCFSFIAAPQGNATDLYNHLKCHYRRSNLWRLKGRHQ